MRVSFLIGSLTGGGAERTVCNLANFLIENGHEVSIVTMSDVNDTYELNSKVKRIYLIRASERKNLLYDNILRYRRLGKYLTNEKCDCHVVMLPITIAMMLLQRKKTKAPVIASERNDPNSYNIFSRYLNKMLSNRADAWVFQTEDAREWYQGRIREGIVIPNAINSDFLKAPYLGKRQEEIVAVGRLDKQKNYDLLLNAFSLVVKKHPSFTLHIYGQGPLEKELKEKVSNMYLSDRVFFEGYVSNIGERIQKSMLYVLTSDYEGMPNSLMEAMALGLPCIATDCPAGGPRFLIDHGENGMLVNCGDQKGLAEAMVYIINNPDFANKLGEKARQIRYTLAPEKIYQEWMKFIVKVVDSSNRR